MDILERAQLGCRNQYEECLPRAWNLTLNGKRKSKNLCVVAAAVATTSTIIIELHSDSEVSHSIIFLPSVMLIFLNVKKMEQIKINILKVGINHEGNSKHILGGHRSNTV